MGDDMDPMQINIENIIIKFKNTSETCYRIIKIEMITGFKHLKSYWVA